MILVWQGYGLLALVIPFLMSLFAQLASDSIMDSGFYSGHPLLSAIVLCASAAVVWVVGSKLNNAPGRVLMDPQSGEQVEIRKRHSLFWIPMQWFSAVIVAIAMVIAFR